MRFAETQCLDTYFYNAGVYMVSQRLLNDIPAGIKVSLEETSSLAGWSRGTTSRRLPTVEGALILARQSSTFLRRKS
jgi:hypothetical protein